MLRRQGLVVQGVLGFGVVDWGLLFVGVLGLRFCGVLSLELCLRGLHVSGGLRGFWFYV